MEETTLVPAEKIVPSSPASPHRDFFGGFLGVVVFLGGVALLVFTFKLAYELFMVPPDTALGMKPGKPLDVGKAGDSAALLVLRIILLLIMAFVGSQVANRGISLYADSRTQRK
jgi:hypothetical protein